MLYRIRNKDLSKEELIDFVNNYKNGVATNKKSRYVSILKKIPDNLYGLDYGCGWGSFTKLIHENKKGKIVGQDQSSNNIEICNVCWEGNGISFTDKKITEFPPKNFDYVVSTQVIEHTHNPGMYLHNINRVLKDDGKLIISLPNAFTPRLFCRLLSHNLENTLQKISKQVLFEYEKTSDHIQAWDPIHFSRLASSCGFEVRSYDPLEGVPIPGFVTKILPKYLNLPGRLKNYSYTMLFVLTKNRESNISSSD